jgi:hypothetical protein
VIEQARALAERALLPLRLGEDRGQSVEPERLSTAPVESPRPLSPTLSPEGRGSETLNSDVAAIAALFQLAYGREPSADELALAEQFLRDAQQGFSGSPKTPDAPLTPWEQLAQVLLLSNEFQFVD